MEEEDRRKMQPDYIYGGLAKEKDASNILAANRLSGNNTIDQFAELVYRNGRRNLKYYADAMKIPYEYFTGTIISISGIRPSCWIDDYIYLATIDLLKKTNLSFNEISARLGFTSANAFSMYCKRKSKSSPHKLRFNESYHYP
jgi:AraC-type DNA-binding domain-containing proteins